MCIPGLKRWYKSLLKLAKNMAKGEWKAERAPPEKTKILKYKIVYLLLQVHLMNIKIASILSNELIQARFPQFKAVPGLCNTSVLFSHHPRQKTTFLWGFLSFNEIKKFHGRRINREWRSWAILFLLKKNCRIPKVSSHHLTLTL